MPDVYATALQFRAHLLRRERAAASEMVRYYGAAYQRVQGQIAALLASAARARGEFSPSWAYREGRLEALRAQILDEMRVFVAYAEGSVTGQMSRATQDGQSHALALIRDALGEDLASVGLTFARVPTDAVQTLVGSLQDGSPLRDIFRRLGPEAADAAQSALVSGLATGRHPRGIARDVRRAMGVGLDRALTISRTETMRAYRESSRQTYAANGDVVPRWRWLCAKSPRTCAVCLAMDGEEFDTDVMMGTHPNCRCVMVPVTKSFAELGVEGVPEPGHRPENGQGWFDRQDAATQRGILGPAKYEALRAGRIDLADLVSYRDDPRWGPSRGEKSLADALAH
jgi:SPP1 gp7 family putative phage head morphogenesis protein